MAEWDVTGSSYIISGTRGSVTEVKGYSQNGSYGGGAQFGWNYDSNYGTLCLRIKITPTVSTESVTFSFTHSDNTEGYNSAAGTYYVKASTTASWPSYSSNDGTAVTLSSAGTKSVTVTLSSPTSSAFYVYLWGYYNTAYLGRYVNVSKLSSLVVTEYVPPTPTGPPIKYYDGSWKTPSALRYYNGSSWVTVSAVKYYNGSSWVTADG